MCREYVFFALCLLVLQSAVRGANEDQRLQVFVVPHSHCDPGWWKTVSQYYNDWTRGIITSVVDALLEDEKRTFIWAEVSFFEIWWNEQNDDRRESVRRLARSGRLEFVTGGWVMPDEANPTFVDMINLLTEGHNWLKQHVGVTPRVGWSIDPFGHSSTMPYLLSMAGFDGMVINRVHKNTKEAFRNQKNLEFIWRQEWEHQLEQDSQFDMFTHMFAYPLYDIPNTCGPSWDTCAQFDFERPESIHITPQNVRERAGVLVDQYKQKARVFRHKNLLIPLGDDFKYKTLDMTRTIFTNYQRLFDYINSDSSLNVNIRFSNLSDYFAAIHKSQHTDKLAFPVYHGDFFTYNDRDNDYWSGYFTTRPFFKSLSRRTEAITRSAEILYALAKIYHKDATFNWEEAFSTLRQANQRVGLFQHHDGITGTSRAHVVQDYAAQLTDSRQKVGELVRKLTELLLAIPSTKNVVSFLELPEKTGSPLQLPSSISLEFKDENLRVLAVQNPLDRSRSQIIRIVSTASDIQIVDSNGDAVEFQLNPIWDRDTISTSQFAVYLPVEVPALGLQTYFVRKSSDQSTRVIPTTTVVRKGAAQRQFGPFVLENSEEGSVSIENEVITAKVNTKGLLESLYLKSSGATLQLAQEFLLYSTRRSGAYLFSPDGPAALITPNSGASIYVTKGKLLQQIRVDYSSLVSYTFTLYNANQPHNTKTFLEVTHAVDMTQGGYATNNKEIITRFTTSIQNDGVIYTDLNGVNLEKRVTQGLTQADYYPITKAVAMQDSKWRFTILTRQALGAASLSSGQLEVMLDRKLSQDDGRGLGEGVQDSVLNEIPFWLVIEDYTSSPTTLSPLVHWHSLLLNYPMNIMHGTGSVQDVETFKAGHIIQLSPVAKHSEQIQILSLSSAGSEMDDAVILRIMNNSPLKFASMNVRDLFVDCDIVDLQQLSVSFIHEKDKMKNFKYNHDEHQKLYKLEEGLPDTDKPILKAPSSLPDLTLNPMEIQTWRVLLKLRSGPRVTPSPPDTPLEIPSPPLDKEIPTQTDRRDYQPTVLTNPVNTQHELPITNFYYISFSSLALLAILFIVLRRRSLRKLVRSITRE